MKGTTILFKAFNIYFSLASQFIFKSTVLLYCSRRCDVLQTGVMSWVLSVKFCSKRKSKIVTYLLNKYPF